VSKFTSNHQVSLPAVQKRALPKRQLQTLSIL